MVPDCMLRMRFIIAVALVSWSDAWFAMENSIEPGGERSIESSMPGEQRNIHELRTMVAGAFSENAPGGVVIIRKAGQTLLHRAYGMADLELGVPMKPHHRLATGSITKQFTAAGILLLVQEGKLALDDDVRDLVSNVAPGDTRISIEQLLTHTSGFPSAVDREDFDVISKADLTVRALIELTEDMLMHFQPGTGYRYSDSGYILLGAVIEAISGLPYDAFMKHRVFEPNDLSNTAYGEEQAIMYGRVPGYTRDESGFINAPYISMSIPYSAGGIYATVEDLADWIEVFRSGIFINPELRDLAWSSRTLPDGTQVNYGFGWNICEISGLRSIGHGGFINGFTANLEYLPDADITIAVMTNQDAGEPESTYLVRKIARLLLTGKRELQPARLNAAQRATLAGKYQYEDGSTRTIFEEEGALYSRRDDNDPIAMVPVSADFLAFPDTEGTYGIEFVFNAAGEVIEAVTRLNCNLMESARRRSKVVGSK